MKSPFAFKTGDTPARLIGDTIGFVIFLVVMFAAMWWLP